MEKKEHLIVFYSDGTKTVLFFNREGVDRSILAENGKIIIGEALVSDKDLSYGWDSLVFKNNKIYYDRKKILSNKIGQIRAKRNALLSENDYKLRIAKEKNDLEEIDYLTKKTKFLRDLPALVKLEQFESESEIFDFNPFGNILSYKIEDAGDGYTFPPDIILEGGIKDSRFIAKAKCSIANGKISCVEPVFYGFGYFDYPEVKIIGDCKKTAIVLAGLDNLYC